MDSERPFYPQQAWENVIFDKFYKSRQIESRLMRSMRNELTKTAQAAREPEIAQNSPGLWPNGVLDLHNFVLRFEVRSTS